MTDRVPNEDRIADGGYPLDRVFRIGNEPWMFDTEASPGGSIRINWSRTGTDRSQWNPLDFIIVPPALVAETVNNLRARFKEEDGG